MKESNKINKDDNRLYPDEKRKVYENLKHDIADENNPEHGDEK